MKSTRIASKAADWFSTLSLSALAIISLAPAAEAQVSGQEAGHGGGMMEGGWGWGMGNGMGGSGWIGAIVVALVVLGIVVVALRRRNP